MHSNAEAGGSRNGQVKHRFEFSNHTKTSHLRVLSSSRGSIDGSKRSTSDSSANEPLQVICDPSGVSEPNPSLSQAHLMTNEEIVALGYWLCDEILADVNRRF